MPAAPPDPGPAPVDKRRKKNITDEKRLEALSMLLAHSQDGMIIHGGHQRVAELTGVPCAVLKRLWRKSAQTRAHGRVVTAEWVSRKKSNQGPKIYNTQEFQAQLKELECPKKATIRKSALALGVSKSQFGRWKLMKDSFIWRHTSMLKPALTQEHMLTRVLFAMSEIHETRHGQVSVDGLKYKDMLDRIHVDEKWFYITRDKQGYYLAIDEEPPTRRCASKAHMTKVMFLCAVARPRWDYTTNSMWDGKVGLWPIGEIRGAQRNSVNRPAGTPEWHNIAVTRRVYRSLLINKVLPAIQEKWPNLATFGRTIRIQQDGAKAHISPDDPAFVNIALIRGLNVELYTQPARSPDLNVEDLGFFRAIQSFNDSCPSNAVELIAGVRKAYNDYDYRKINRVFLTLQTILNEIIECNGDNTYKIPHMGKERLEREGRLPLVIAVTEAANQFR
jgi:hypothetical protein